MKKVMSKNIIYLGILLLVFGISVGFSALQRELLIDDFIFNVRLQEDTRVSASTVSKTGGSAISNFEDYNVSKIYGSVTFPSTSSYVLYKVDLTNYGNIKTGLLNITSNTSGVNYQVCDSNGNNCTSNPKTSVCNGSNCTLGSTKSIYVKVTSTTTGTKQIDLDLNFKPYHTITYNNFYEDTTEFQTEIMETDTYEVTLTSTPEVVDVSGNGFATYNESTHKLTISAVSGNITVNAKYKATTIAETSYSGTEPDNYVLLDDVLYRIVTKESIDDGYGNTELRTKLVKETSIGNYLFDENSKVFSSSSLYTNLNEEYYPTLSSSAKELIDTIEIDEDVAGYITIISSSNYSSNSSWFNNESYVSDTGCSDNNVSKITSTGLVCVSPNNSLATFPSVYLKTDILIVGGNGSRSNPYLLEQPSDGYESNPTKVTGKTITVNGYNQELITVSNIVGTPYFSVGTSLNSTNYSSSGSTSIPQRSAVGTYTVYYYIPAMGKVKAKSGKVTAKINGIKYTINYTAGANITSIGKTNDSCTTTGTSLTCNVTLPTITPASGWENGKWNYNNNQYNPNSSFTLNATNNNLTMTSSVTGKTYTATFYFNTNTTPGNITVDTRTENCNVTTGNSCTVSVPSDVSSSVGKYNSAYKGVSRTQGNLASGSLTLTGNQNFYAFYSSAVTYKHYGTNQYVNETIYRNEYFSSATDSSVVLASSQTSTTSIGLDSGPGGSDYVGLSEDTNSSIEYSTMSSAASSNASTLIAVYKFDITYQKGANVSSIGKTSDSCYVYYDLQGCNLTLPSITANAGYTSVGWSLTSGDTTGVTGTYPISQDDLVLYANAKGNTYTATFYYNSNTTSGSLTVSQVTSSCTVTSGSNCTVAIPSVVTNSVGKYNSAYIGVSVNTSLMDASSLTINDNNTNFYAIYRSQVNRYYYSSGYKNNTIYRNEYFIDNTQMQSVLTTSDNGTTNYTTANGPGSSSFVGLSTAQDTTPEYNTVQEAANSDSTTLYTVYQFTINYQAGANVSAVGSSSATCKVTTSDTSCTVILPTITPDTNYTSVGWSLTNGDTTGEPALSIYTVDRNNRVLYANALLVYYQNVDTGVYYETLNQAFNSVSNNQTIRVIQDTTETILSILASGKTGIKLDLNGKTITTSQAITNNGQLNIYNSSTTDGFITYSGSSERAIINNNDLSISNNNQNSVTINHNTSSFRSEAILNSNGATAVFDSTLKISCTNNCTGLINNSGDMELNGTDFSNETHSITNKSTGNITLINVKTGGNVYNQGNMEINNSIIEKQFHQYGGSGNTIITGSNTIISDNIRSYAVKIDTGTVTILDGTITGNSTAIKIASGATLIMGTNDSNVSTSTPHIKTLYYSNEPYTIHKETGGIFNYYDGIIESENGTNKTINDYVDDNPIDYTVHKTTTDGVETAILEAMDKNYLNTTTNRYYETLGHAFYKVANNQTIQVVKNASENKEAKIAAGKAGIKLDLNGHTISFPNTGYSFISNAGILDIYNTSSTTGVIESATANTIANVGTLTTNATSSTNNIIIRNTRNDRNTRVLYNASATAELTLNDNTTITYSNAITEGSGNRYLIENKGNLTVAGATLTNNVSSTTNNCGIQLTDAVATFTMTSGTINTYGISVYNSTSTSSDAIRITNGSITSMASNSIYNYVAGGVSISNGIINGNIYNYAAGAVNISGGSITGATAISNRVAGTINVTGGTITGTDYGIRSLSTGVVTIGTNDSTVNTSSPLIQATGTSNSYGVSVQGSGTFNFYDGIIKSSNGTGYAINGTVSDTPTNYEVYKETNNGIESAFLVKPGILMEGTNGNQTTNFLRTNIKKQDIESITFTNSLSNHTANGTDCFDVSKDSDESVLAWVVDSDSDGKYEMTIASNGMVRVSSGRSLFSQLRNLDSLNGIEYLDISNVTNMSYMFYYTGLSSTTFTLDLGDNFDTSNVTDMNYMFHGIGKSNTSFTLDLGDKFDTSNVTDMSSMFYQTGYSSTLFTLDLGDKFDTSKVTNMYSMFYQTGYSSPVFTLNLGDKFDTSNVTNMQFMFCNTGYSSPVFTLDLGDKFGTSKVTDMSYMFDKTGHYNPVFTLDLGDKFDTSNVTNMRNMFEETGYNSTLFTLDLGDKFDTSNVTNMSYMFNNTGYNSPVFALDLGDKFDTSKVTDMSYMFQSAGYSSTAFTLDLGDKFDTSNVTTMSSMFSGTGYNSPVFTLDLGDKFDTSNVTNMSNMFFSTGRSSTIFTLDLGSKFDTSSVTNMYQMFYQIGYSNTSFTLDLGDKFDTSNVTDMYRMFRNSRYLKTIYAPSSFVTTNVTSSNNMFDGCTSLVGGSGTAYAASNPKDKTYAHIDGGTSNPGYFTGLGGTLMQGTNDAATTNYLRTNIAKQDIESITFVNYLGNHVANGTDCFDVSKDNDGSVLAWVEDSNSNSKYEMTIGANGNVRAYSGYHLFSNLTNLDSLNGINILDTSKVTDMRNMFNYTGYNSATFTLDLGNNFDTSNVTNMYSMFYYTGRSSTVFTLDLGDKFDTSKVTDMSNMFSLTGYSNTAFTLDLGSKFDTSNVTTMKNMFQSTGSNSSTFTLDLGSKFDTSNVTNMQSMFYSTGSSSSTFTLDLGDNFDTSNVTNMSYMFYYTGRSSAVFTLDLGDNFDTSNVTNMSYMFEYTGCSSTVFTLDLGDNFDTSNVTDMYRMFYYTGYTSPIFTLDLGDNFDTSKVTDMSFMFSYTGYNSSIFTLDLGDKFDTSSVINMERMFECIGYSNTSFTLDLGDKFDTSSAQYMSYMFANVGYNSSTFTLDLGSKFDTSSVTNMSGMFNRIGYSTTNLTLDLGDNFDTSNVTNMYIMFSNSRYLKTIYAPSTFVTTNVTNSTYMFDNCTSLVGGAGTVFDSSHIDATYAHWDEGTTNPGYFTGSGGTLMEGTNGNATSYYLRTNIIRQDIESITFTTYLGNHVANGIDCFDVSKDNDGSVLAWVEDANSNSKYEMTIGANGKVKASSGYYLFSQLRNLDSLNGMDNFDTSNVTNMNYMFNYTGHSSTTFTLNLGSNFDTSKVTRMDHMFYNTGRNSTAFTLNLGNKFDTSNVTTMSNMFYYMGYNSTVFTLNLGNKFDTSNVTTMSYMFNYTGYNSTVFTLNLGNKFDTSNVTNMSAMFSYAGYKSTAFTLDLGSKFDTSNVTNMSNMFCSTGYSNPTFTLDLDDNFDTSNVANMSSMFKSTGYRSTVFSLDLGSKFDTSNVTTMQYMFYQTGYSNTTFTLDLNDKFDTSKVTTMSYMFYQTGYNSPVFTLDLGSKFDTSNVANMSNMFNSTGYNSLIFTLNLGDNFDTSKVTDMSSMFSRTGYSNPTFTLDLGSKFDTSIVTNMQNMFYQTGYSSSIFTLDLESNFDTSNVTDMNSMFNNTGRNSPIFILELGDKFDTSNVTNMSGMFTYTGRLATNFILDLGDKFDTSNVTTMSSMFGTWHNDSNNESNIKEIIGLEQFNTSNVTNMNYMFGSLVNIKSLDLSSFDTSSVTDMNAMFIYNINLETIYASNSFVTTNVTNSGYMFYYCTSLVGGAGTVFNSSHTDKTYALIDEGASNPGYFTGVGGVLAQGNSGDTTFFNNSLINKSDVEKITLQTTLTAPNGSLGSWDASQNNDNSVIAYYTDTDSNSLYEVILASDGIIKAPKNSSYLFSNFRSLVSIIDLENLLTSGVKDMSSMFYLDDKLLTLDVSGFNTSSVTNMASMFSAFFNHTHVGSMSSLTNIYGLENFDTSNVTNMSSLFRGDVNLTSVNLSSFNTSNVTNMSHMFDDCSSLTLLDISSFDTSNVTNMNGMFYGDDHTFKSLRLTNIIGINTINTSKVTDMRYMFSGCSYLSSLDLSNFDTTNVTDMSGMFRYTGSDNTSFTLNLGNNFDTSNVTDMSYMFYYTGQNNTNFTLDLGDKFDTSNVTNMNSMFQGVGYNNTNFTLDLGDKFDTSNVTDMRSMFSNSRYLKTIYVPNSFVTTNVTRHTNMFYSCTSLVGGSGTVFDSSHTDKTYAHIDGGVSDPGYFTSRSVLSP